MDRVVAQLLAEIDGVQVNMLCLELWCFCKAHLARQKVL
jgi:hypothetical protein